MKLEHNDFFDSKFEKIPEIRFFPYVGKQFQEQENRIMIFAHNMYVKPDSYDAHQKRTASKTHFADAVGEFTYVRKKYTRAWRSFIKASTSISFNINSDKKTISKVEDFIEKISHINYINDWVKSDRKTNVEISEELILRSNSINIKLLEILKITHCVCWGKNVFNYLTSLKQYEVLESNNQLKKGFGYARLKNLETNKIIHVLKVFHPSMPSFGNNNSDTQRILKEFYEKK